MKTDLPAAEGGAPVRAEFLPFARPSIGESEIRSVTETLRSGWLALGPRTREFERAVARYVGVPGATAVHSCTAGLHLGMVVFGVGEGDEVVMPTLNFASAANMAIHLRAVPVLVDVDPVTLNVTADLLEQAITSRTKLMVPVHFGGRPCDMETVLELAETRGVRVLGDGAHAIGADYHGSKIGSMADATSFSFYVTKGITTGEGGIITSPREDIFTSLERLRLHGMSSDAWKRYSRRGPWYYEILDAGYKYNMNDIQAALGLCQIERVDEFRRSRTRIARIYAERFAGVEGITVPDDCDGCTHAWHLYPIQIDLGALRVDRDRLINCLLDEGIGVSVHFMPLHLHPFFRKFLGYAPGSFPVAERYFERAISLPIYPSMTDEDVGDVVAAVTKLLDYYRR